MYIYNNVMWFCIILLQWQSTPLHWAAEKGHTDSVALLVASGADINMKDQVS